MSHPEPHFREVVRSAAARHFIDFWMGPGSWAATPASRQGPIADSTVNVRRWAHALFTEPTPIEAFAALQMPILYLLGDRTPESAKAVARVLLQVLPNAQLHCEPSWGHMVPITHADAVNAQIAAFLRAG